MIQELEPSIEENIEHYREVTVALKGFEAEVESVLRSTWREFKEQLAAVGIREEDASFKTFLGDEATDMYLKGRAAGIEIGIALGCRDTDDVDGRFTVYSWVWVRDPDLRKSVDEYVETHLATRSSPTFIHEFDSTTYIVAYLATATKPKAIDLLRGSFTMLFECLYGSPDFSKTFSLSGPAGKILSKDR